VLSPREYTILDTPAMSRFAKKFLNHHNYSDVQFEEDSKKLVGKEFDLFISNICLSETPEKYRQFLFDEIMPNCKRCFIIDGDGKDDSYNEWLEKSVKTYFPEPMIYSIPTPWNVKVYMGEQK
jgi:hypothetical protein